MQGLSVDSTSTEDNRADICGASTDSWLRLRMLEVFHQGASLNKSGDWVSAVFKHHRYVIPLVKNQRVTAAVAFVVGVVGQTQDPLIVAEKVKEFSCFHWTHHDSC